MSQRYLVLDSDPLDDGVRWSLDRALPASLPDLGFEYRYREGAGELFRDIWESEDGRAVFSLVSDRRTPAHYLMIEAADDELAERVSRGLEGAMPVLPLATLQERAGEGDDPSALVRMALASDLRRPDQRSTELISRGLEDREPLGRYRAAEAAGLAPSSAFCVKLEAMARDDPEDWVRAIAEISARTCAPRDT